MLGRTISHYEVLEKLGAGGMGEIYKAQDTRLNRIVVIKVLSAKHAGDLDRRRRFIQEAQAASSLNHPHIITIHDIVSDKDNECIVMEFVTGKTLTDLIPSGGMNVSTALDYAIQIADALDAAHTVGIIHRDLKPGNIMVTGSGRVKILDFGLAKLTSPNTITSMTDDTQSVGLAPLTIEGSIMGTVSYMSPEQAQGKRVDPRSDIFSFGAVLYEMVTGRKAFEAESTVSTLSAILRDDAAPMSGIVPGAPADLERIIQRALRKDPDQRWQSMKEMQSELVALQEKAKSQVIERPPAAAPRKPPRTTITIASIILLVVALGGVAWWIKGGSTKPAPSQPIPPNPTLEAPQVKPAPPADAALTNRNILEMTEAKVPADVIIGHIRSAKTNFDLSTSEIIQLSRGGVPAAVIEAMRNPSGRNMPAPPTPEAPAVAPPIPPPSDVAQTHTVQIVGGVPFVLKLVEAVPVDIEPGKTLRFEVMKDVRFGDAVVIAKGTPVLAEVVEGSKKKFLGKAGKPRYRLQELTAVDGSKLKISAAPMRRGETKSDRPIEPLVPSRSKDVLAAAGSEFLAYFDGDQTVTVRR